MTPNPKISGRVVLTTWIGPTGDVTIEELWVEHSYAYGHSFFRSGWSFWGRVSHSSITEFRL